MKPLFYMLAHHGPWNFHVEINGAEKYLEVIHWLSASNHKVNTAYEVLGPESGFIGTRRSMNQEPNKPLKFIFLFKDGSLASYVKMTWG